MNECACTIDANCDGEFVTLLTQVERKARKEHKCYECGKVILKKEKYLFESYVFDEDVTNHKTCFDCKSLRDNLFCTFIYGRLWENFHDDLIYNGTDSVNWDCIPLLTSKARDKVLTQIQKFWDRCDEDETEVE